jgi:SseB protein N-terminal domain
MLSVDPGDGPGSSPPGDRPPVPAAGAPGAVNRQAGHTVTLSPPRTDIVPPAAMANGGTIIRPGAVAWGGGAGGGHPQARRYSSCEAVERALAAVVADPAQLPGLLTELATTRLWVPLPDRRQPFTDGVAVRLPVIGYLDTEFVPCFTSVQRLSAWADLPGAAAQRAGDARTVPHVVVPAGGLAGRLPAGTGLALNPGGAPGLPLYPECVPYLARLAAPEAAADGGAGNGPGMEPLLPKAGAGILIGYPPAEPTALLAEARAALRGLPAVLAASRAWLTVPGRGAGLVIAVGLDDPASQQAQAAALGAIKRAAATVALRVPFALDVTFTGEPAPGVRDPAARGREARAAEPRAAEPRAADAPAPDPLDAWIARNTRPFYVRA